MRFLLLFLLSFSAASAAELPASHRNAGLGGLPAPLAPRASEFRERAAYTPAEFAPAAELQMTAETFRRMESQLVGTIDQTADIVVVVKSASEARSVVNSFRAKGGNTARLKPTVLRYDSFWYQDYGPFYSVAPEGGLVSNDFTYNRYGRVNDDAIPERLASLQGLRNRKVSMNYEGGNFISDGRGRCFASSRIYQQNPQLSREQVNSLMDANLACHEMIILTPLKEDITFHIDLFAKMLDERSFVVGDFVDQPENKRIMDANAATLAALGYIVHRFPVRNPSAMDYRTHVNAFLLNGYVLLPNYGGPEDRQAHDFYERLGWKVLDIDTSDLTGSGGAVHCILRSKPAI